MCSLYRSKAIRGLWEVNQMFPSYWCINWILCRGWKRNCSRRYPHNQT